MTDVTDAPVDFGADRFEDARQQAARTLLIKVTLCLKLAGMHRLTNAALNGPVTAMREAVNALVASGPVAVASLGENLFLNRELLRLDQSCFESAQTLQGLFRRLGIHELSFGETLSEERLRSFLAVYQTCLGGGAKIVEQKLDGVGVRLLNKAEQAAYGSGTLDDRQNVLRHYVALALSVKEAAEQLSQGRPARFARLRRAAHALADASVGHDSLLVGITRLPSLRGEPHFHLASVTALCLGMGRRLRLPKTAMSDLALAALLHDLARFDLPVVEAGAGAEWLEMREAASRAIPLQTMLKACAGGFSADVLTLAAVAGEQTLRADSPDRPSALARLIAVPCAFDRLTLPSPPARALPPDRALRLILDRAPGRFDERVARLFASVVGLYPVGTTVRLSNGDLAVVLEAPTDPSRLAQPRVKVVQTRSGAADYVLDLAAPGAKVQIACCVEPEQSTVNVPQLLLA